MNAQEQAASALVADGHESAAAAWSALRRDIPALRAEPAAGCLEAWDAAVLREEVILLLAGAPSSTDIAERCASKDNAADDSTVLKGVKAAAKLLAWNLARPPRRRRNRKIH